MRLIKSSYLFLFLLVNSFAFSTQRELTNNPLQSAEEGIANTNPTTQNSFPQTINSESLTTIRTPDNPRVASPIDDGGNPMGGDGCCLCCGTSVICATGITLLFLSKYGKI